MSDSLFSRIGFFVVIALLILVCGRVYWLVIHDQLSFESDVTALLPNTLQSEAEREIEHRVTKRLENRIVVLIKGNNSQQTTDAADELIDFIENDIDSGAIAAVIDYGVDVEQFSQRLDGMLSFKDRLLTDQSIKRLADSSNLQLAQRIDQITQFPPTSITDPVRDPLGTLDEFLSERMPKLQGVQSDGLYLRIQGDQPGILVLISLIGGGLGGEKASQTIRNILTHVNEVQDRYQVNILTSGIPLHATEIRSRTMKEVRWMSIAALTFTFLFFLYVTRSIRALVSSVLLISFATIGAIAGSDLALGLPHLIGLTMATTAIGICIDFSLHFWVHVRSGLNGSQSIAAIRSGINMGFLTTSVGLVAIACISIPVLARSSVFILCALVFSWAIVLFVFPQLTSKSRVINAHQIFKCKPDQWSVRVLFVIIVFLVLYGLSIKLYTDDSPSRLGQQIPELILNDRVVEKELGMNMESRIYLISASSAEEMLSIESSLLSKLSREEKKDVVAISRLVPDTDRQLNNQVEYEMAIKALDIEAILSFQNLLNVEKLDWHTSSTQAYTVEWVIEQNWADLERSMVINCGIENCSSMIRANGHPIVKLDEACMKMNNCEVVRLSNFKTKAFKELRINLLWSLVTAGFLIFCVLYLRYKLEAFTMILVPILASLSGVAAVAIAGMPVTTFTLASLFPLLGLSIDYVVFVRESISHRSLTMYAVSASAITTAMSFIILSFSSTPAVQFFSIPIAVGISVAWLLVQFKRDEHAIQTS